MTNTLWAVHIQGPDDLVPVADYLSAIRCANAFNAWWAGFKTEKPLHDYDPRMWASPVEWTGDIERHAEWVKNPSPDYACFINLAAQQREPGVRADVSVGELAGFFATEFPPLMTMSTQIEVARALLARYKIERLDRLASSGRR